MAGLDSREDDGIAEIELTYSILDDINQARLAFGRPAVCIIQVEGTATPSGIEEYLILLSVSETCRYKNVDFLEFLCSREKDINTFLVSRGGAAVVERHSQPGSLA